MFLDLLVFREQLLIKCNFSCLKYTTSVSNYTNHIFLMSSWSKENQYDTPQCTALPLRWSTLKSYTGRDGTASWCAYKFYFLFSCCVIHDIVSVFSVLRNVNKQYISVWPCCKWRCYRSHLTVSFVHHVGTPDCRKSKLLFYGKSQA
jgi:hypothetical protein